MLEKLNVYLYKSKNRVNAEKLAAQILYVKKCDLADSGSYKNAIRRLSRVFETYLRIDRYNNIQNKNEVNSLIFNHLVKANLICIREFRPNYSKSNDFQTLWLDVLNSGFLISFPCGSMKPEIATEAIKHAVISALKTQHPSLLTNKAFLTVMCIRQFYSHSFFAKLPKDIIKIIFGHAKNTYHPGEKLCSQQKFNAYTSFKRR